jgi:hypothetical protein
MLKTWEARLESIESLPVSQHFLKYVSAFACLREISHCVDRI